MADDRGAKRRLELELEELRTDPIPNVAAGPVDDDMFHWQATILGAEGTPYAGGVFFLDIRIPANYPFVPPKFRFTTPVFHYCVTDHGGVCADILSDNWSPALSIGEVLLSICSLLADDKAFTPPPREDSERRNQGSKSVEQRAMETLFRTNKAEHDRRAREFTSKYAK